MQVTATARAVGRINKQRLTLLRQFVVSGVVMHTLWQALRTRPLPPDALPTFVPAVVGALVLVCHWRVEVLAAAGVDLTRDFTVPKLYQDILMGGSIALLLSPMSDAGILAVMIGPLLNILHLGYMYRTYIAACIAVVPINPHVTNANIPLRFESLAAWTLDDPDAPLAADHPSLVSAMREGQRMYDGSDGGEEGKEMMQIAVGMIALRDSGVLG
ncbi:hypothetical protein HK105_208358 [Polyrhizophydium stewartii]|uniref:Uncharacterized protein n=1 Tax=Polyrhizophydium stewartii TaxID=2732419 RepID=A0ABR4MXZ7_9FUNG